MLIDDYLPDGDDMNIDHPELPIGHPELASLQVNDKDIVISNDEDTFLDEVMNEYHSQQDHHNTSFGKASDSEISKLQGKVNEAEHNVDVKKQDVHERQMQYNYNPDTTTARRLSQAKNELSAAQRELENAKYKLNQAR